MPNPLFNMLNGGGSNPVNGFVSFMQQMKGRDLQKIINDFISSGRINQEQLNGIQQRANQMHGFLTSLRECLDISKIKQQIPCARI